MYYIRCCNILIIRIYLYYPILYEEMNNHIHRLSVTENIFTLLLLTVCMCVFALHLIILICWLILLFKSSIRLRKKLKYLTTVRHTSDIDMNILNSQVEYRKNLFMFAIVLFELISSILIIMSIIQYYEIIINNYVNLHKHREIKRNTSQNTYYSSGYVSSQSFPIDNIPEMTFQYRVIGLVFEMPLIFTITLVYTLMSYYVMVAKKSLNYLTDLKSVALEREQKTLLILSPIACVVLLLLLVRIEVYLFHYILEVLIITGQLFLTVRFRKKLVRVLKWKMLDARIAFGTNHYQFKSYSDTLRKFKLFTIFYLSFLFLFDFRFISRTLLAFVEIIQPKVLYAVYKIEIVLNKTENITLDYTINILHMIEQVFLFVSLLCLFLLNVFSLPYLLSKINFSFHCNCNRFCSNKARI